MLAILAAMIYSFGYNSRGAHYCLVLASILFRTFGGTTVETAIASIASKLVLVYFSEHVHIVLYVLEDTSH